MHQTQPQMTKPLVSSDFPTAHKRPSVCPEGSQPPRVSPNPQTHKDQYVLNHFIELIAIGSFHASPGQPVWLPDLLDKGNSFSFFNSAVMDPLTRHPPTPPSYLIPAHLPSFPSPFPTVTSFPSGTVMQLW